MQNKYIDQYISPVYVDQSIILNLTTINNDINY